MVCIYLVFFVIINSFSAYSIECEKLLMSQQIVRKHDFDVERELKDYYRMLGPHFIFHLAKSSHWFDSGAGNLGAVANLLSENYKINVFNVPQEYLDYANFFNEKIRSFWQEEFFSKLKITALTYKINERRKLFKLPQTKKLKILTGKYFEETSSKEIESFGKVSLLTDVMGVFTYSSDLWTVLSRYYEILDTNGVAFIALATKNSVVYGTSLRLKNQEVLLVEWLSKHYPHIFSLEEIKQPAVRYFEGQAVRSDSQWVLVIKKSEEFLDLPKFKNIEYSSPGTAPSRVFELAY